MRLDAALTLPDQYLQKVDVATMAFSVEARCPLTDYRLVEWAMRLPLEWKLRGGQTKYLLKRALCRYLPDSIVYQPKLGFQCARRSVVARPAASVGRNVDQRSLGARAFADRW